VCAPLILYIDAAPYGCSLTPLAIALPQFLEPASILRLAGLLFDLLDELLALWASREVFDEPGE
jgi:hypothetical protein